MATKTETTETVVEPKVSITTAVKAFIESVPKVIASGNVKEVEKVRKQILNLRTLVGSGDKIMGIGLTQVFDDSLQAAQGGFNGDDFLKGVTTILKREGKGRKAAVVVVNEEDYA
jgi:hypothetical protein